MSAHDFPRRTLDAADVTALSHLYRGELYRSTVWRTRLDATTNWSVATTGIALSVTFSSPQASPLPLLLVSLLVAVFLTTEARRYRFFDFWRIRAHILELHFFGPILRGRGPQLGSGWGDLLFRDYHQPHLHIGWFEAVGRRVRRTYGCIFAIQGVAYIGKLLVHPTAATSMQDVLERAALGPLPGDFVLFCGLAFHGAWIAIAIATYLLRRGSPLAASLNQSPDPILDLARGRLAEAS
jgi:uncharacterized membrane protein